MIWKASVLVAIKRAQKVRLEVEDIAEAAGLTVPQVRLALDALAGRDAVAAAELLNEGMEAGGDRQPVEPATPRGPLPEPTRLAPVPYRTPDRRPRGASIGPRLERLAIRMKDVSDRVARWAWWFVAAGWEVGEVADLFDVDARELDRRVMAMDGGLA